MALSTDSAPSRCAPVSVVVTNPEWEEHLLAWAAGEAGLRHSDVRVFRTGPADRVPEAAPMAAGASAGGLIVVGPVSPRVLTDLLFRASPEPVRPAVVVVGPMALSGSGDRSDTRVITVGFHGSASAQAALRWAIGEAATRDAAVRAVLAWSESQFGVTEGAVRVDPHLHSLPGVAAGRLAERSVAATGFETCEVQPIARRGTPTRVLVDEAIGSDLLVVGAGHSSVHGRQVCGATTLGSVSRSTVPVVIVPL